MRLANAIQLAGVAGERDDLVSVGEEPVDYEPADLPGGTEYGHAHE